MTTRPYPDTEAAAFISKHTVALLLPSQFGPGGVRLVGSGSLVKFDERYFILTATHVWAELRESEIIHYSAIATISHAINLYKASLNAYSLDNTVTQEPDPFAADLTLLELNPVDYRKMDTRLSFFSLEREATGPINDCVIIGAPGVLAKKDSTEVNTLSFEIRAIFVQSLTTEAERDGLDFLKSLPYEDPTSPISDYRGLSGGGLWSVFYYPEKLMDERYEVFLIGVNFYKAVNEIRCLGRKAIKKLIQQVRDALSKRKA
jgi:hypothetical protein